MSRCIAVPDLPSSSLPAVLFPIVSSVVFDVEDPLTVAVGDELELTPTVLTNSGLVLSGTAATDVNWKVSDTSVFSLSIRNDTLVLRGVVAGEATLTAERRDLSLVSIPSTSVSGSPWTVIVT